MQKQHRLRKSKDFEAARREGRSWADRTLVLVVRRTGSEHSRFGFSVSKRIGNAVVRNRVKRKLREVARTEILPRAEPGWDFVVIARKNAADADYHHIKRSLLWLFRRSKLLNKLDNSTHAHEKSLNLK